ncbi:hypothetical protein [Polynucleobacter sp. IMCC 29146]|uniref:hypothetical protein n=1 Tax=Polynucleobacter sp. IMCC 29146 TaxID=2780953 RepID=UPI001F1DB943|nr:hypothetical protein [Polynucleobacter sp. IMCC 29146]MCE7528821.1 hypothetical protein [Polynucleobacter sp. IMCC 29146]
MIKLIIVITVLGFSSGILAQNAALPQLPKNWSGIVSVTAMGNTYQTKVNSTSKVGEMSFNSFDIPATITILKQEGRHLEFLYRSANYESRYVGTLSMDGKQIQIAYQQGSGSYTLEGNKLSGCGSGRGGKGTFKDWLNSYSTWCEEFTALP